MLGLGGVDAVAEIDADPSVLLWVGEPPDSSLDEGSLSLLLSAWLKIGSGRMAFFTFLRFETCCMFRTRGWPVLSI